MKMNLSKTMSLWHSKDFWLYALQKMYGQELSSIMCMHFHLYYLFLSSQWPFEFGIATPILQVRKLRPRGAQILDTLWPASVRTGIIKLFGLLALWSFFCTNGQRE